MSLSAFVGYGSKRFVDVYVTKRVRGVWKQAFCGRICHLEPSWVMEASVLWTYMSLSAFVGYGSKRFVDVYVTKRVRGVWKQAICGRIFH